MEQGLTVNGPTIFTPQVVAILNRLTPKSEVKWLEKGGKQFAYVDVDYIRRQLDEAFGRAWSFETKVENWDLIAKSKQIVVHGRLTILLPNGERIVKEQYGGCEIKFYGPQSKHAGEPLDVGNDVKSASSDALKKCASLVGIASDVYSGEYKDGRGPAAAPAQAPASAVAQAKAAVHEPVKTDEKPKPKNPGAQPTAKQIKLIEYLAEKNKIEMEVVDSFCQRKFNHSFHDVTMGEITPIVEWLQSGAAQ